MPLRAGGIEQQVETGRLEEPSDGHEDSYWIIRALGPVNGTKEMIGAKNSSIQIGLDFALSTRTSRKASAFRRMMTTSRAVFSFLSAHLLR